MTASLFVSETQINFSKKEDYVLEYMKTVAERSTGNVDLSMTEVTMFDSIYDPFGAQTFQRSFLNFDQFTYKKFSY